MASVRFESVGKTYDSSSVALSDFTLDISDGEFVVLVGPSGCGKSTTLRVLAGLEEPTTGRVFVDGRDITGVEPSKRDIAMVFQNYALYPHMTVFDNMAFSLRMKKASREEAARAVEEAAEILGISEYLQRKPRELSGGQRQRVAVGRAIVRHPKVFLFDEPLSNLDAKLRVQMRNELARLHSKLGATMIYVTHDQAEAMTLGDRIVVLKDGFIQQVAPPLEVYDKPVNRFVAGFIGSPAMNFFQAEVSEGSVKALGQVLGQVRKAEGECTLGIRPEDVEPWESGIEADVEVVETLGNEKVVIGTVQGQPLTARTAPDLPVSPGDVFRFRLRPEKMHFFSADGSESRI
ncbi:MAG TPA: ABC transporter ATP-binding protein [Candidatus Sabulitectum sp.]|nr:ABC transporter ATP-binding protein [Candidatus Sabulitectum sp.]HPF31990.1 ABC transporter ATP-binding protein [Candidatus Sabulitectum sp.]HPR22894.1 ABC transporter ATP-binding protein [Candidatus Sabulitectum sp.]